MVKVALWVRLQAKPGKEQEVRDFLAGALALADREAATPVWFALRLDPPRSRYSMRSKRTQGARRIWPATLPRHCWPRRRACWPKRPRSKWSTSWRRNCQQADRGAECAAADYPWSVTSQAQRADMDFLGPSPHSSKKALTVH